MLEVSSIHQGVAKTLNTVAWFEVAIADPEAAEEFYGELFGWTVAVDRDSASAGSSLHDHVISAISTNIRF